MMKYRAEDGRVVMRSSKKTNRKEAQTLADELERAARKAQAGELTRAVALKALAEMMERTTGEALHVESTKDFFEGWLKSKEIRGASEGTVKRYRPVLRGFLTMIGDRRASASVGSVTDMEIARYHELQLEQGKGPTTANFAVKVLGSVFATAVRRGLMLRNPAKSVEAVYSEAEERKPFTDDQIKAIIRAADEEWKGMILFGVHTGIRLNDAARLTWGSVDVTRRVLSFEEQKTARRKRRMSKETRVRLHPDILQWLSSRTKGAADTALFPSLSGSPSGGHNGLSNAFYRVMAAAGVKAPLGEKKKGKGRRFRKLGFHSLRHTLVSRMANEDVPADVRKAVVGHSSDEIHQRYVHLDLSAQDKAIAKLRSVL